MYNIMTTVNNAIGYIGMVFKRVEPEFSSQEVIFSFFLF